jgi:hypothetical protein
MPVGDRGQTLKLLLAVLAKLALQNAPGGKATQGFVSFIDLCQQLDAGLGIAAGEAMPKKECCTALVTFWDTCSLSNWGKRGINSYTLLTTAFGFGRGNLPFANTLTFGCYAPATGSKIRLHGETET